MAFKLCGHKKAEEVGGAVSEAGELLPLRRVCRSSKSLRSLFRGHSVIEGCSVVKSVLYGADINKPCSFSDLERKLYAEGSPDIFWVLMCVKYHEEVLEKVRPIANCGAEVEEEVTRSIFLGAASLSRCGNELVATRRHRHGFFSGSARWRWLQLLKAR